MDIVNTQQRNRIHPHKFTLWVAIGSIIMMFAGLTSAYIVKRDQPGWTTVEMPRIFWYSTVAIVLSSVTIQIGLKAFKERERQKYKALIISTLLLGCLFVILQIIGFQKIWNSGITFKGAGSGQFLYIIFSLHAVHLLGGIVALLVMFIHAFSRRIRNYSATPIELMTTYWHFVDVLWIYLFVFFLWIQ